jgi:hypothetical protein
LSMPQCSRRMSVEMRERELLVRNHLRSVGPTYRTLGLAAPSFGYPVDPPAVASTDA